VGLTGEIRPVTAVARRLAEAQRLGFRRAITPPGNADAAPRGMTVIECSTLALAWAAATAPGPPVPLRSLHRV
jgi:DNA repair protein RadA/Sms